LEGEEPFNASKTVSGIDRTMSGSPLRETFRTPK
jgi:hypothetical protein